MNETPRRWADLPALFDLSATAHGRLFSYLDNPWSALTALDAYLDKLLGEDIFSAPLPADLSGVVVHGDLRVGKGVVLEEGVRIEGVVHIGPGSRVESGAYIRGPAWIGAHCEVRQGAFLRGIVLAGDGAVLGHCSEFKRCILLEGAQAPHFNYVGDSVMGIKAHIGAGVILSNVRLDKKTIRVFLPGKGSEGEKSAYIETGLEKFGAVLGDACEVGCNSVLNPGTILGARTRVAPLSRVRGSFPEGSILQ